MSVERDGSGSTFETIGAAPDNSGYVTLMAWARPDNIDAGSGWRAILCTGQDSGSWAESVLVIMQNLTPRLYHRGAEIASGSNLVNNRWYHVALYGDFSVAQTNQITVTIYDSVTGTENTFGSTGFTGTYTEDRVYFGTDPSDEWIGGGFAFGKCWERELTINEIRTERWSGAPIFLQNLWGAWDLYDVNDGGVDRSGNGRDVTYTFCTTIADGPPVSRYPDLFTQDTWIFAAGGGALTASGTPSLVELTASGQVVLTYDVSGSPVLTAITASGAAALGALLASGSPAAPVFVASGAAALQALLASGVPNIEALIAAGNAFRTSVGITDVNTTESWTDGDTGLVITGTGFL